MGTWLCRVEGVNFNTTVFDTNDLSTVRGASLGLLHLDRAVTQTFPTCKTIFSGASQCAVVVERDGDEATVTQAVRKEINAVLSDRAAVREGLDKKGEAAPPFPALTTVIDVVPVADERKETVAAALRIAEARNRSRQFRQWTLDPLEVSTDGKDVGAFEHGRPGTVAVPLPKDKGRPRVLTGDGDDTLTDAETETAAPKRLSFAVAAKREYGRTARQKFYAHELGSDALLTKNGDRLGFVDSLEDMPHADWTKDALKAMPQSVRNKIAVVYADGNGFGAIREQVGVEAFSKALAPLRKALLKAIITWFVGHARGAKYDELFLIESEKRHGRVRRGLRLETLMWGGDELLFAMPAWLALPFVAGLHAATRDWTIGGHALTQAIGVTIAHHKTPIRQLTRLAHEAADGAKAADLKNRTTVTVDVFESLAPPDAGNGLDRARDRLFGAPDPSSGEAAIGETERARLLAMPGDSLEAFIVALGSEKQKDEDNTALPRSQMYAALRAARAKTPCLADDKAAAAVRDALDTYAERMGKGGLDDVFPARNRPPSVAERPLGLELALVTELWDYIHPGGLDIPPMTVTGDAGDSE